MNNLSEIIENAVNYGACNYEIIKIQSYNNFEEASTDVYAPFWCWWYAVKILKERWKEGEKVILTSPEWSYNYAINIIKGRWEEAESVIFSNDHYKQAYYKQFNISE